MSYWNLTLSHEGELILRILIDKVTSKSNEKGFMEERECVCVCVWSMAICVFFTRPLKQTKAINCGQWDNITEAYIWEKL